MKLDSIASLVPNQFTMSVLRITSYQGKNFEGYIASPHFQAKKTFQNLTQLLFLLEELAENINYLKREGNHRSFSFESRGDKNSNDLPQEISTPKQEINTSKPLASFKIHIIFKQNASWQGSCEWIEEKKSANFRSTLELIQLMDSAL